MQAKEWMRQAAKLDRLIDNKIQEVNALRYKAQGISSAHLGERVQEASDCKAMERRVAAYMALQDEIDRDIDRYIAVKGEIVATIEQLDGSAYDVLHKLYLQGMTMAEVAGSCQRSYSWAVSTHAKALASLQKILDSSEKSRK